MAFLKMIFMRNFIKKQQALLFERAAMIAQFCYFWISNTKNLEQWDTTDRYINLAKREIFRIRGILPKEAHSDLDEILHFIDHQRNSNHPMVDYVR